MDSAKQPDRRSTSESCVKAKRKKLGPKSRPLAESTVKAILAAKSDTAKRLYVEFGPGRTMNKVRAAIEAAIGPVSDSSLRHWSGSGKWMEAAQAFDLKTAQSDHEAINRLYEIAKVDELAAMELVRCGLLDDLLHIAMKPTDRKALVDAVRIMTNTIEQIRAPDSSRSRDRSLQGSTTNVTVQGDVYVNQNRAIAMLDRVTQSALPKPEPAQVIDVAPTQVSVTEPAEASSQEQVKEDKALSSAPLPEQPATPEPVAQQKPARSFLGVGVHKLAELAAADHVSFAEALERLKQAK